MADNGYTDEQAQQIHLASRGLLQVCDRLIATAPPDMRGGLAMVTAAGLVARILRGHAAAGTDTTQAELLSRLDEAVSAWLRDLAITEGDA